MSTVVSVTMAALIGLVGLAACGSDGDGDGAPVTKAPVTKAAFIAQSDDVCARFGDAIGPPLAQIFEGDKFLSMDGAEAAMPQVETAIRGLLDERQALRPPEADADTISDVLTVERRTFEKLLTDVQAAIDAQDPEAIGAAFDRADVGFQPIDAVQQDYGFQFCGAPALQGTPSFEVVPPTASTGTRLTVRSITPCQPTPAEAAGAGTRVRVNLWSTSTRQGTRGGRILVDLTGPLAADGSWQVEFEVPTAAIVGKHAVNARCEILNADCPSGCPYGDDLTDDTFTVVPS